MGRFKGYIHWLVWRANLIRDYLSRRWRARFGWPDPLRVVIYRGYGAPGGRFRVGGRVLANAVEPKPPTPASAWGNAWRMLRHFRTKEIRGACVALRFDEGGEDQVVLETDREGYFWFEGDSERLGGEGAWRSVTVELLEPRPDTEQPLCFAGEVQLSESDLGVISDIDDTIIRSGATDTFTLLKTTLSYGVLDREVFEGLADFYQGLRRGSGGRSPMLFWYLSSSAWNMYDFFEAVWEHNELPRGSFLLRDLGITEDHLFKGSHEKHKLGEMQRILKLCPNTRFILVGDSGQHDPQIYHELARQNPGRVAAIYIRQFEPGHRDVELERRASELAPGIPLCASPTLDAAVEHAASEGWLGGKSVDKIERALEEMVA